MEENEDSVLGLWYRANPVKCASAWLDVFWFILCFEEQRDTTGASGFGFGGKVVFS